MRKLAAVTCLVFGLAAIPGLAGASPIGTNKCALDADGVSRCDIFADYTGAGASGLGAADGNLGGYLPGYTFLLNLAADLSDGFQEADVAHILVVHDSLFELFSNTVFNSDFAAIFASASTAAHIDGVAPSLGQLAGCPPTPSGVPNLAGIGYCNTADLVTVYPNWGLPTGDAGQDVLRIFTALPVVEAPPDTDPVPEPGTLSLLALGATGALASWRRRRNTPA
jgi:hypothetical protein